MFDFAENGSLLMEVPQLKGVLEVLLLMCNHDDTKQVHSLLAQLERAMLLYPLDEFATLETHAYLCQVHGYRSDFFAARLEEHLQEEWERYQGTKGHLHRTHQANLELVLARKFMVTAQIVDEREDIATRCIDMADQLFDTGVWQSLESPKAAQEFFQGFSFESQIYFKRAGIMNLLSRKWPQYKIDQITKWCKVGNIVPGHEGLLEFNKEPAGMHNYKVSHGSRWQDNPHARLTITFQLAISHYHYLKVKNYKEARAFLIKFLQKAMQVSFTSTPQSSSQE